MWKLTVVLSAATDVDTGATTAMDVDTGCWC